MNYIFVVIVGCFSLTYLDAGEVYGGISWLYLQPMVSDSDFQYGTHLTLTDAPANLNAHVLDLTPSYQSGVRANLGYQFPCTFRNLNLTYFYFGSSDQNFLGDLPINQFTQNFLGGNFTTAFASECQRLHMLDLTVGEEYGSGSCIEWSPFGGVRLLHFRRDLDVQFTDLRLNHFPSSLMGELESRFWGLGPYAGTGFRVPLGCNFSLTGQLGVGVLFGHIDSKIDSVSERQITQSFRASDCFKRVAPVINSNLAVAYTRPVCDSLLEVSLGWETDYFFNVVNRVEPFEGYVNNPQTFPVSQSSSVGLGGPLLTVSLLPGCGSPRSVCPCNEICCESGGFYGRVQDSWVQPCPNEGDLDYAVLNTGGQPDQTISVDPSHTWWGTYQLGYLACNGVDFRAGYSHLNSSDASSIVAGQNQSLSTISASGNTSVVYSSARSMVDYNLNQIDLSAGRELCYLTPYMGLRWMRLERTQHKNYEGGVPDTNFETITNKLISTYWGVGPLFGVEPHYCIWRNWSLVGNVDLALLVGKIRASVDQQNQGTVDSSSNTLRADPRQVLVPVVDVKAGARYTFCLCGDVLLDLEIGYLFTDYFRAIDLVFPNFLTGLNQTNSDLKFHGPYVALKVSQF